MKRLIISLSLATSGALYCAIQDGRNGSKVGQQWTIVNLWTREYVIALCADLPNLPEIEQKLSSSISELGEAFLPYYGKKVTHDLTGLLRNQQTLTLDLIKTVLKNDPESLKNSELVWKQGAMKLANFLAKINPYISFLAVRDLLQDAMVALVTMTRERQAKKWKEEMNAYDQFREKNSAFGKLISQALENAFPKKVRTLEPKVPKPTPFGLPSDVTIASPKK